MGSERSMRPEKVRCMPRIAFLRSHPGCPVRGHHADPLTPILGREGHLAGVTLQLQ
jgi:hypothetical protein